MQALLSSPPDKITDTARLATFRANVNYPVDISMIKLPPNAKVLDLGCGETGSYIVHELVKSNPGVNLVFIDPFQANLDKIPLGGEKAVGWSTQIPFPDSYFDLVVTAEMTKDNRFFFDKSGQDNLLLTHQEIKRVLNNDGLYVAYHEDAKMAPRDMVPIVEDFESKNLKNGRLAVGLTYGVYQAHCPDFGSIRYLSRLLQQDHDYEFKKDVATFLAVVVAEHFPELKSESTRLRSSPSFIALVETYGDASKLLKQFAEAPTEQKLAIAKTAAIYSRTKIDTKSGYWQVLYEASFACNENHGCSALKVIELIEPDNWLWSDMLKIVESSHISTSITKDAISKVPDQILPLILDNLVRCAVAKSEDYDKGESIGYNLLAALKSELIPKEYRRAIASRIIEHYEVFGEYQPEEHDIRKQRHEERLRSGRASDSRYNLLQLLENEQLLDPVLTGHAIDLITRSRSFDKYDLERLSKVSTLSEDQKLAIKRRLIDQN